MLCPGWERWVINFCVKSVASVFTPFFSDLISSNDFGFAGRFVIFSEGNTSRFFKYYFEMDVIPHLNSNRITRWPVTEIIIRRNKN